MSEEIVIKFCCEIINEKDLPQCFHSIKTHTVDAPNYMIHMIEDIAQNPPNYVFPIEPDGNGDYLMWSGNPQSFDIEREQLILHIICQFLLFHKIIKKDTQISLEIYKGSILNYERYHLYPHPIFSRLSKVPLVNYSVCR